MTAKQIYEATAIELSKVQAPTLKLYEFNYFFNQAIRQFVNKVYNVYDVNQQTTDDLRVLKSTATLLPQEIASTGNPAIDYLHKGTYFVDMPDDYLHLLNCVCLFNVNKTKDCWDKDNVMVVSATKLTADNWSSVIDDVYNRPSKKHPYYYIHNQNDIYVHGKQLTNRNSQLPTNINSPYSTVPSGNGTDHLHQDNYKLWFQMLDAAYKASKIPGAVPLDVQNAAGEAANGNAEFENCIGEMSQTSAESAYRSLKNMKPISTNESNFDRTFDFDINGDSIADDTYSNIEKPAGSRHANASKVKVEIRCGRDKSNVFSLSAVQIDYVKAPQFIRLTQEQLDSDEDISQVLEFPDYVNQEIVNELVNLVMRKVNDPSLSTHMQITQSIARPTGQSQTAAQQA